MHKFLRMVCAHILLLSKHLETHAAYIHRSFPVVAGRALGQDRNLFGHSPASVVFLLCAGHCVCCNNSLDYFVFLEKLRGSFWRTFS